MKKILCVVFVSLFSLCVFSQKLEENKVDEFTKKSIKRTSWEKLMYSTTTLHARISKVDSLVFFEFKFMDPWKKIFSVKEGSELMFKLDNDEILTLKTIGDTYSSVGAGAIGLNGSGTYGVNLICDLNPKNIEMLSNHKIVKVRFNTSSGYLEYDIKEKYQDVVMKELKLIQ